MRAIAYPGSRSSNAIDCLVDVDLPEPLAGPSDLLVRVEAVAVNPVDTKVRRREQPAVDQWRVLGWDAAGTVEAVGSAVNGFQPGDQVWYAGALDRPGCNSELHAVDHRLVARKPISLSAADAVALPLTSLTAWELLFDRLRLPRRHGQASPVRSLLVVGAAGGVGSILVQLVQQLTDLQLVATASRPESRAWLERLGVTQVIDHHQPLGPQLALLDLPPLSTAISLTHTDRHFAELVELLEPQGALALIDDPAPESINVLALKRKSLSLHWELMFTRSLYQTHDMARQGEILTEIADLVDAGVVRTTRHTCVGQISAVNLQEAHHRLEQGRTLGKLVLSGWPG